MRIEDDHYYVYDNHIGRGPEFVNGVLRDYGVTYNVRCTIDRLGKSSCILDTVSRNQSLNNNFKVTWIMWFSSSLVPMVP